MEFFRPEYWSGWLFPSAGGLPNPGIEPRSPALQVISLPAEPQGKPKNTGVGSLSLPSPADLPNPGIKPGSPALQADSLPTELSGKPSGIWSSQQSTALHLPMRKASPAVQGAQLISQNKLESIPELNEGLSEKEQQLNKGKELRFWGVKVEKILFSFLRIPQRDP